jgi:hypothetical protein
MTAPSCRASDTALAWTDALPAHRFWFLRRLGAIAVVLVLEWAPISARVSTGRGGQSFARALVAFCCCFFVLAFLKFRRTIVSLARVPAQTLISWQYLAGHISLMLLFLGQAERRRLSLVAPGFCPAWVQLRWLRLHFFRRPSGWR